MRSSPVPEAQPQRAAHRVRLAESGSFTDDVQVWDASKVATIVSDQRYRVPNRAGGDPKVVIADEPLRAARGLQATLNPGIGLANLEVVGDNSSRMQMSFEIVEPLTSPILSLCPIVKLAHRHERNQGGAVLNVRSVKVRSRIGPAQEVRENIGI